MMSNRKARGATLAAMAVAAAAMAAPVSAQEGSEPLVPSQQSTAAQPAKPPTPTTPQTVPSPPSKPASTPLAAGPNAHQATTGAIARQAAPAARAPARPALAVSNVNLRSAPGTNAEIVATIPGGSTVRISGCTGEWCAVSWQGRSGFAIARAFDSGGARQARAYRVPRYDDEDVVEAGPPLVYDEPPAVVYGPRYYYSGPRLYPGGWRWRYAW